MAALYCMELGYDVRAIETEAGQSGLCVQPGEQRLGRRARAGHHASDHHLPCQPDRAAVTSVCAPASGSVFPPGTTPASCTATDASSNASTCTFQVSVVDTTPPTITSVAATPDTLWPPNRKMVPIVVTAEATDVCGPPTCRVVSVASDEPVDGLGDGDTSPDWTITGDLAVSLRAERAGGGDGRAYTITVECEDSSDSAATAPVTVRVPHGIGKK